MFVDKIINEETMSKVSSLFKVISDPTRINILYALKESSLSVTELTQALNMSQSAISHQLKVLRDANLVINQKKGKEVIYSLADSHVYEIFNQAIEHVEEDGN